MQCTKWLVTDRLMPIVRYFHAFQWLPLLLFTSYSSQFQRIVHFDQKQSIQYNCCVLDSNAKWRCTFLFIIENHSIPDIQKWENKSQYDSNSSKKAMKYGWHYLLKRRILKVWISGAMVFFFFFHLLWCNAKEPKESK